MLCGLGCATAPDSRVITCAAGADCDAKWSRAMQWLQQNSSWKVQTQSDMSVTTEGPDTGKPAFEVTKGARDNGTFRMSMRAWCGEGEDCERLIGRLGRSFNDYVLVK